MKQWMIMKQSFVIITEMTDMNDVLPRWGVWKGRGRPGGRAGEACRLRRLIYCCFSWGGGREGHPISILADSSLGGGMVELSPAVLAVTIHSSMSSCSFRSFNVSSAFNGPRSSQVPTAANSPTGVTHDASANVAVVISNMPVATPRAM